MPAAAGKDYAARGTRAMTLAADSERRATESRQDKVAFWNDPRVRSFAVQATLIAAVIFFAYEITHNTYVNLKSRNIASGYGFLGKTAGFDITDALVSYSSNSTYWDALVVGFLNTIRVSLLGIVLATIIGFVMGVARLSRNWLVAKIGTLYVEIFRNVPLLLWMFIIYGAMLQPLPGPKLQSRADGAEAQFRAGRLARAGRLRRRHRRRPRHPALGQGAAGEEW
jgi:general L-amino acid transport system permease protein